MATVILREPKFAIVPALSADRAAAAREAAKAHIDAVAAAANAATVAADRLAVNAAIAGWGSATGLMMPAASRAVLAGVTSPVGSAFLYEAGRSGVFTWYPTDFATALGGSLATVDPRQGLYVPPASAPTGASGAWVREARDGDFDPRWWGALYAGADETLHNQDAINFAAGWGRPVFWPELIATVSLLSLVAGSRVKTAGLGTVIQQKSGTTTDTRLLNVVGSDVAIGDLTVRGNIASDSGEQMHGIFIQPDGTTGDMSNITIGNVVGEDLRGDVIYVGTDTVSGSTLEGVNIGDVHGDDVLRNVLSITGGRGMNIGRVTGSQVGFMHFDIEPDPGAQPPTDIDVESITGNYAACAPTAAAEAADQIHIRVLDLDPTGHGASQAYAPGAALSDAFSIRNTKYIRVDDFKANGFNGQALQQIWNSGELGSQRISLGRVELSNCCLTETTYNSFIEGIAGVTILSIERLIATPTLTTHRVLQNCNGSEVDKSVLSGPVGSWRAFSACTDSIFKKVTQTNGIEIVGCHRSDIFGGTFNGATFSSFNDDVQVFGVTSNASTAQNSGGSRVVFFGSNLDGTHWLERAYTSSNTIWSVDALGAGTATGSYTAQGGGNYMSASEFRVSGTKVVGARKSGWTLATGTATRGTFATSTVTLAQLAEHVKALIDDLHSGGGGSHALLTT